MSQVKTKYGVVRQTLNDNIPIIQVAQAFDLLLKEKRLDGWNNTTCLGSICGHVELDKHSKKLGIQPKYNFAKCFKCGTCMSDCVEFLAHQKRITKQQAQCEIAYQFGMISEQDYQNALNRGYIRICELKEKGTYRSIEHLDDIHSQVELTPRAHPKQIEYVYRCLMMTYATAYPQQSVGWLSREDYTYLCQRGMTPQDIDRGGYFTLPPESAFPIFEYLLRHHASWLSPTLPQSCSLDYFLKGVPGFYQRISTGQWSYASNSYRLDDGTWSQPKAWEGIGIPIRNASQQIVGIQVRRRGEKVKKGTRYLWFTSTAFENKTQPQYQCGVATGSHVDVVFPTETKNTSLFITEGRFKAQAIANQFGSIAISVQGIQNLGGLTDEIYDLMQFRGQTITHLYVAFDADMAYNESIFLAGKRLTRLLKQAFPQIPIYYMGWNVLFGKGIDDAIQAGHQDDIMPLSQETLEELGDWFWDEVRKQGPKEWKEEALIRLYNQYVLDRFPKRNKTHHTKGLARH